MPLAERGLEVASFACACAILRAVQAIAVDRSGAAIGVAEIWRFNGTVLRFSVLQPDGSYLDCATSQSFPFLRHSDLLPFLAIDDQRDETTCIRQYMQWLREHRQQ